MFEGEIINGRLLSGGNCGVMCHRVDGDAEWGKILVENGHLLRMTARVQEC